jgi:hypothetical protein
MGDVWETFEEPLRSVPAFMHQRVSYFFYFKKGVVVRFMPLPAEDIPCLVRVIMECKGGL